MTLMIKHGVHCDSSKLKWTYMMRSIHLQAVRSSVRVIMPAGGFTRAVGDVSVVVNMPAVRSVVRAQAVDAAVDHSLASLAHAEHGSHEDLAEDGGLGHLCRRKPARQLGVFIAPPPVPTHVPLCGGIGDECERKQHEERGVHAHCDVWRWCTSGRC